jgi:hypothetical protein
MSITQPPRTGAAEPMSVVPRPRTVTGTRCRFASTEHDADVGLLPAGVMTASGRKEILLLSNDANGAADDQSDAPGRSHKKRPATDAGLSIIQ